LQTLGASFSNQTALNGRHFCGDFQRFFPDFQGFCPDFRQIKTFGGELVAPATAPPTPLL